MNLPRGEQSFWAGIVLVAVVALVILVGVSGANERRVSPEAQRMIDQMKADAANRTPEPCISFTTRGFVPCP